MEISSLNCSHAYGLPMEMSIAQYEAFVQQDREACEEERGHHIVVALPRPLLWEGCPSKSGCCASILLSKSY